VSSPASIAAAPAAVAVAPSSPVRNTAMKALNMTNKANIEWRNYVWNGFIGEG
jgi:hypothetical protein